MLRLQELAQQVVDAGAVPLLVLCVQEPELSLKRVAASALSDIAKHSPELAQAVVDAGAVAYLAPLVTNQDAKLKRQVRAAREHTLSQSYVRSRDRWTTHCLRARSHHGFNCITRTKSIMPDSHLMPGAAWRRHVATCQG